MTLEVAQSHRVSQLPEENVSSLTTGLKVRVERQLDEVIFLVAKDDYRKLCERLLASGFDFPSSLSGVDMDWGLGVVLQLSQIESRRKVTVRVYTPYSDPHVPTVSDLWGGVDWHEREAYDLVGLHFDGHHDHRRILLEDHWTIHPLQRKYNTRGYLIPGWQPKPWPSPAPWEEGFTPFAAAAPVAHAPAAKPAAPAASVAAPAVASSEPAQVAPSAEAPKKATKRWVPKTATGEAAPSAETPAPAAVEAAPVAAPALEPAAAVQVPEPAAPQALISNVPDDLKHIEGIGPKMNQALLAAGIDSFAKLAATSEQSLREAIEKADLSFAPSMSTWAEQASLLARGDEAGFKALTERLVSGRSETSSQASVAAEEKPKNPKIKRWEPKS